MQHGKVSLGSGDKLQELEQASLIDNFRRWYRGYHSVSEASAVYIIRVTDAS